MEPLCYHSILATPWLCTTECLLPGRLKPGQTLVPCTLSFLKVTAQRAACTELLDRE